MNKRGSRLLLDTSFLLPVLGFETSPRVMAVLPRLTSYELYYSELSILEALWKIVKALKNRPSSDVERVVEGVEAIRESMRHAPLTGKAVEQAVKMYMLGHKDMVDNLLYSTALANGLTLLTVDEKLVRFVEEKRLPRNNLATPEELP